MASSWRSEHCFLSQISESQELLLSIVSLMMMAINSPTKLTSKRRLFVTLKRVILCLMFPTEWIFSVTLKGFVGPLITCTFLTVRSPLMKCWILCSLSTMRKLQPLMVLLRISKKKLGVLLKLILLMLFPLSFTMVSYLEKLTPPSFLLSLRCPILR